MSEPFLAEIRIVPYDFAPRGWAFCNGQLMLVSQNTALFALLGTAYGGDGKAMFGLPNLQGAAPLGAGSGPGLTPRSLGERGGATAVTLLASEMPSHSHSVAASTTVGNQAGPEGNVWAQAGAARGLSMYATSPGNSTNLSSVALRPAGGGQPHNNMPPYLTLNFIIALQGVFPQRP